MKLAISREKEINDINDFLKECSWLSDKFKISDFEDMDWEEFEIFKKYDTKDVEGFLSDLVSHAKSLFWEKAIWNLQTLLENCSDKTLDHLDFSPEIKKGFEAVEILKECRDYMPYSTEHRKKINELLGEKADGEKLS